ncbi:MAG: zf-HC2 domain-containing protein, partial [Myxococcaceae bacterium]|nr:zf-HC2 domain-containing protein [Myxococcaceae bacterium]
MYTCQDSINLLLDYLDGEMPAEVSAELREHLAGCSPCVEFVESYRATPGICREALKAKMPPEVARRLT